MIVAHGTWLPGRRRFFLWAEQSARTQEELAETRGSDEAPRHPYQLDGAVVEKKLLQEWSDGESPVAANDAAVTLLLPSQNGAPLPSPHLILNEEPAVGNGMRLAPWQVHGLSLTPELALGWLAMLPSNDEIGHHERLGDDLRYWSAAARFALELLARQRFLPGLVSAAPEPYSQWEPLLDDELDRLEALRASMPPVCRALVHGDNGDTDAMPPDVLLRSFLESVTDRFVRQAASRLRLRPRFVETSGELFAASLLEQDGFCDAESKTVNSLQNELASWKSHVDEEPESPFRIAFRLEPPTEPEPTDAAGDSADEGGGLDEASTPTESWQLRFFLQALDDESLLVPLARVWEHVGSTWRYLERRLDRPQEMVLERLGHASTLFAPIEESLRQARPESCAVSLADAYRFLNEGAFLLRDSGYGVLVPSWWGTRESSLGLNLKVSPRRGGPTSSMSSLGLDAVVEFDWQVAMGGESLSRQEFLELAELKQPLVKVRGQWVELSPERAEEVIQALKARPAVAELTLKDVLHLKFGRLGDKRLPVTALEATGWVEELFSRLSGREAVPKLEPSASFVGELRPYQKNGLGWLAFLCEWGMGACLADDMGLGKTIQMLAYLLHLRDKDQLHKPFLLICPTSVVGNWRKEAERFAPSLRVLIHHGLDRHGSESFTREVAKNDLVVSSYSLVHRDLEELRSVDWGGLVLDEAQNIKNSQAKQTRTLRKLVAPIRIALTGTPVENRLAELWSIMEFLNPGFLGTEASFKRHYAVPIERYRDTEATEELRNLVEPFILRRLKTDPTVIKDLPPKNEMKVYCTLTQEQATLYQAVVQESLERIETKEGMGRKGEVLAALTRLKQICNHPAHLLADGSSLPERSGKLSRLTEMLEEVLAEGDRALVFTQYAEMGKLIQRHLRESLSVEVSFLHGAVASSEREKMISRFQEDEAAPPIFILSLKAGGFGLNLTQARHVFHYDRWWNPAVEDQATDRAFRIGQTRSVSVYKFICAGTIEERVDAMSERKKALAETVISTGEGWLTELSTESLRDLFQLRQEAIEG